MSFHKNHPVFKRSPASSEKASIQKNILEDLFLRNLTLEEKDFVCSLGIQVDLELKDLPIEKWNE